MRILDTRDLIDELIELTDRQGEGEQLDEDELSQMNAISNLVDEIGDEAQDGIVLIPEDDFVAYAEELAEEIGAIDSNAPWPVRHIDWEAAADELRVDYSSVTFDGVDYLYRT